MKYERSTLALAGHGDMQLSTQALRVGDWYVHYSVGSGVGLTVSHRSGIAVRKNLTPGKAVAVVRVLLTLPPCPIDDDELRRLGRAKKVQQSGLLYDWITQMRDVTEPYALQMIKLS